MRRISLFAVLVLALTWATPVRTIAAGKKSVPQEVSSVGASFSAAVAAKDAVKAAALYSNDALLMGPNSDTIKGRANIEQFWRKLIEQGLKISTSTTQAEASGSLGYEVGTYELWLGSGAGEVHDTGKYVNLMKREADGHWRMIVDIWNSSMPATHPEPPRP